jgi:hypothetical protein
MSHQNCVVYQIVQYWKLSKTGVQCCALISLANFIFSLIILIAYMMHDVKTTINSRHQEGVCPINCEKSPCFLNHVLIDQSSNGPCSCVRTYWDGTKHLFCHSFETTDVHTNESFCSIMSVLLCSLYFFASYCVLMMIFLKAVVCGYHYVSPKTTVPELKVL